MNLYQSTIKFSGVFIMLLLVSSTGFGQKSARTNTHFSLQEAKELLIQENFADAAKKLAYARENIDKAVNHEQTKGDSKTWVYRGDVYAEIMRLPADNNAGVPKIEAAKIATESFKKAMSLDDSKRQDDAKDAKQKLNNVVYVLTFNTGLENINAGDNANAIKAFEVAMMINDKDTNAALNAAIAAERMKDFDKAFTLYKKMIDEMGANDHFAYIAVTNNYVSKEEYDKALEYISRGLEVNNNSKKEKIKDLLTTEFNVYLKSNRLDEAISNVKKNLENDPENDGLYSRLGQLYDQMRENAEGEEASNYGKLAVENYKKALELNPANLDANYNLGAFYYNKAASIYKEVNNMDLKTYQSKGVTLEKKGEENFNLAIPYFKKAFELAPDDAGLKNSLKTIYTRLKNYEEAQKYN